MAEQDEEHDMYVAQLKQVFESCDSEGISPELSIFVACLSCCAFYATLLLKQNHSFSSVSVCTSA